ncbi:MFS transporter [Neobacillus vireti]|uniref:Transporter, major facilitator family protein n=1 Tax=Neobacillus vireti LMG 21834 TaxID=1131730 RepID=A0AB94ISH4_9BACI|nr:MFS transporter [Neobacillus vireti]ETI69913.1 putative transporter, major facilitator family protein [Neobacillus vireti LMG 21834]KLT17985.1 MFS transporter [Neobacillus vireti]
MVGIFHVHKNKNKNLFMVVSFLLWFPHFIYIPILSPYMESIGGGYTFIGIVLSSYGLMQLLCRLPIGIFSDLLKLRKPFIIIGMLASTISCTIYLITDSLGWILVARTLAGLGAASWVAFTVLYPSYFTKEQVHRAMGSISFIVVLAQFLGMSFSGYLVDAWGFKSPFWIGAFFSLIGTVLSFFIFEPKEEIERAPVKLKELASVMREPSLLKVSFLSIIAHSIIFSTMFGFTSHYALDIGFKPRELTFIVAAFMIPHAIATLFMGSVLVPRLGEWKSLIIAFSSASIFTIMIPFIETKGLFLANQGFSGFALGLIFPLLLGMSIEKIAFEKRATAMGAYQALYAIGIFAGPFFSGIFNAKFGIAGGFYFVGSLGLIATILVIRWNTSEVQSKLEKGQQKLYQN